MPRNFKATGHLQKPDPKFGSMLATKIINKVMLDGKKTVAQKAFYDALDIVEQKTGSEPVATLKRAVDNVRPQLEVRSRRVGGATYQVPVEVRPRRATTLAIRWLVGYARERRERLRDVNCADDGHAQGRVEGLQEDVAAVGIDRPPLVGAQNIRGCLTNRRGHRQVADGLAATQQHLLAGIIRQQVLLGDIGDVLGLRVLREQMIERLVLVGPHVLGDRQPPFLGVGELRVDVEDHPPEGVKAVLDHLADEEGAHVDGQRPREETDTDPEGLLIQVDAFSRDDPRLGDQRRVVAEPLVEAETDDRSVEKLGGEGGKGSLVGGFRSDRSSGRGIVDGFGCGRSRRSGRRGQTVAQAMIRVMARGWPGQKKTPHGVRRG